MNIYNIIPVTPLTKETLKKYKNDMEAQVRMNMIKNYVQKIYSEIIRSAMYGDTNYIFALYNQPYLQDKEYILTFLKHYFYNKNQHYSRKNTKALIYLVFYILCHVLLLDND